MYGVGILNHRLQRVQGDSLTANKNAGLDLMSDYAFLVISAALVNNLVLTRSLGLCALMSGSRSVEISIAVALATSLTLMLCTAVNYLIDA